MARIPALYDAIVNGDAKASAPLAAQALAEGRGFIFQSDHSVPDNIAPADYDYVVELVRKHGVYPLELEDCDLTDLN